jgi:hypothetical protein
MGDDGGDDPAAEQEFAPAAGGRSSSGGEQGSTTGTSLADVRERIESLAGPDGEFYLRCGRTGDRPVPAAGLRFETRATARRAARATERYRAMLRRYDPRVPCYDVIVHQELVSAGSTPIGPPEGGERVSLDAAPDDGTRTGV